MSSRLRRRHEVGPELSHSRQSFTTPWDHAQRRLGPTAARWGLIHGFATVPRPAAALGLGGRREVLLHLRGELRVLVGRVGVAQWEVRSPAGMLNTEMGWHVGVHQRLLSAHGVTIVRSGHAGG